MATYCIRSIVNQSEFGSQEFLSKETYQKDFPFFRSGKFARQPLYPRVALAEETYCFCNMYFHIAEDAN